MSSLRLLWLSLVLCAAATAQDGLLLHYPCDEGSGKSVADRSTSKLEGTVSAAWADSPSGKALSFDGQSASIVRVILPAEQRLGKESFTFSAWLKPTQFTFADRQNQRRIFSFGVYPDANVVLDLMGNGQPSYYLCYKAPGGTIVSAGGGGAMPLELGKWAHLVVVCDRRAGTVDTWLNGFNQGGGVLPPGFAGDFSLGGELTLGNGWHNYWGLMDEVKVARRAWARADVKAEFARLKDTFGVVPSPAAAAAEQREQLMADFARSGAAWAQRDFAAVRSACAALLTAPNVAPQLRSYAHLRLAESWAAEGKNAEARAEYAEVAGTGAYPAVHRYEAEERARELARVAQGKPARDPAASRTSVPRVGGFAAEVFVAPGGADTGDGSRGAPVASLTRARDLVRRHKARGVKGPLAVTILPGKYQVTAPLELSAEDSGSAQGPVVWRASEPGKAVFYGGAKLTGYAPVTDPAVLARLPEEARGKVLRYDLRGQGITDYGKLAVRGFGQAASPPTLELFVDGRPMTLARWPNSGFVPIKKLVEPGNRGQGKPSVFEYANDRHARWTQAEEPWLFGYFRYLWADATIKVTKVDPAARTVTCGEAYHYGQPGMHPGQGIAYYAFNLLEEIDQPGEWYLDRQAGVLYLYPPKDLADATVEIGLLASPMVTMTQVSDLRLEGLVFDLARFNGLVLTDCQRCLLAGCTVSRMAGNGIMVHGGEACGLLGCDVHTIGRRATEVIGGDRPTLKPGGHFVENCRLYDMGRIDRTYTPAIQLEGVGNRVAHNLMYDCPSSVMRIEGNDHVMEYNDVHSAVRESDDQGAMELFGNPTYRGVVFRYNRFVNCGKTGAEAAVHGQAAIRFDDAISGMLVYGNLFVRSANGNFGALQLNSGRDNVMDNNVFVECKQGISGGWYPGNHFWRAIAEKKAPPTFITNELYRQRYPEMVTMMDPPGVNRVWRNLFYRCGPLATGNRATLDLLENAEYSDQDPGFVDAAKGDWRLRPDAPVLARVGLRPLPLDEVGLYADAYRASWPVVTTPVAMPDWRKGRK